MSKPKNSKDDTIPTTMPKLKNSKDDTIPITRSKPSKPKNSKDDTIPSKPKNSKDDTIPTTMSRAKNDDDASKSEKLPKIRLIIRDKKRNIASCSGATNSKTTDGGTNSKPDIGTNSKADGPPKLWKRIYSDKKDVTESRPMGAKPCLVDNCERDGGFFDVCEGHMWSVGASVNGTPSTFCHLCHLFQNAEEFDAGRHICKKVCKKPTETSNINDAPVKGKPMKFCQTCMMFQNISDFDPGSLTCKSRATVEKETPEKDAPSKLLELTEEMHSNIADMGTQLVRLAEDTERMQQDMEQTQLLVLKGNMKLREEVQTSNKRLREDLERRYTNLQKSLGN